MSGECSNCSEHCLDCKCTILPTSAIWSKSKSKSKLKAFKDAGLIGMKEWKDKFEIHPNHLLELIHWARRYCDGRSTYAPSQFNQLYENIVQLNPYLKDHDEFDQTLKDKGKYWPYAQDGMFNEKTGAYDARPMKPKIKK